MRVRALTTFGGNGIHISAGDEFELPEGVDWLRAGLVEAMEVEPEAATIKPKRKATRAKPKRRTRAKKT